MFSWRSFMTTTMNELETKMSVVIFVISSLQKTKKFGKACIFLTFFCFLLSFRTVIHKSVVLGQTGSLGPNVQLLAEALADRDLQENALAEEQEREVA